jgi:hypothetical protein
MNCTPCRLGRVGSLAARKSFTLSGAMGRLLPYPLRKLGPQGHCWLTVLVSWCVGGSPCVLFGVMGFGPSSLHTVTLWGLSPYLTLDCLGWYAHRLAHTRSLTVLPY